VGFVYATFELWNRPLTGGLKKAMVRSFPELKIRSEVMGSEPTIMCGRPKTVQVASQTPAPMLNMTICSSLASNSWTSSNWLLGGNYVMKPHQGIGICITSIRIFEACIHSKYDTLLAGFINPWIWRIPDHSLTTGTVI
jgi:hypothetical protein